MLHERVLSRAIEAQPPMFDPSMPSPMVLATVADGVMGGLRWLDVVGLAIVAAFLVLGGLRGLWWQLVRLFGVVAAFSVARAVAPRVAPDLQASFPELSERLAHGLAWVVVLGAGMLVVGFVGRVGKATIDAVALGPLDRIAGAAAGAISGLCLHLALVLVQCQLATPEWTDRAVRGTHSEAVVDTLGRNVPRLLDARARAALAFEG